MKKRIFPIIALALSATACVSDADLDVADNKGYINVSVSADNSMETRTVQTVDNLSEWTIMVGETEWRGTTQGFEAGAYNVTASNYVDLNAALAANSSYGDAWYQGTASATVTAGQQASVSIECGKAQNARIRADIQSNMPSISDVNVKVYKTDDTTRQPVLSTTNTTAYFEASAEISYEISYQYNGESKTLSTQNLTLGAAGYENVISIKSNQNGSIRITVTFDDDFTSNGTNTIIIDAATGNEVNSQE